MILYRRYIVHLLCLSLLAFSNFVHSSSIKFITIKVAPWAFYNDQGNLTGVFPDLVSEIEERTEHSIDISLTGFSFDRIKRELDMGRQDCTGIIIDREILSAVDIVELILEHPMGVIARDDIPLHSPSDLVGLKISSHKVLSKIEGFIDNPKFYKEYDENYEKGLKKIEHGRVDAIAGAIPTILYIAKKNNIQHLLGTPLVLKKEPVYLQCSKNSKNLMYMESVGDTIRQIKKDGTLDKILDRYS